MSFYRYFIPEIQTQDHLVFAFKSSSYYLWRLCNSGGSTVLLSGLMQTPTLIEAKLDQHYPNWFLWMVVEVVVIDIFLLRHYNLNQLKLYHDILAHFLQKVKPNVPFYRLTFVANCRY